jgi:hypothetical protein
MHPSSRLRKVSGVVLAATLLLFCGSSSAQESGQVLSLAGKPDGLQLSISLDAAARPPDVPAFKVELRNVGKRDLLLDLGTVSSNGQQYPTAVSLILGDQQGDSQRLQLKTFSVPNAPGTKPLLLPLPVGATFSFPVDLRNYWVLGNKEFSPKLKPGTYSLEAQFAGLDSGHLMPTLAELPPLDPTQMPFDMVYSSQTGMPTSNQLHFRVARP